MFASNQPHEPWNRGNRHAYNPDKIKLGPNMLDTRLTRIHMARYFAEISYLDSLVGECMGMVERSRQKENTIIIFTTEQGNSFPFSKWTLYDQGLRSGFIVKWPGKTKPGTRNPAMLQYMDVLPTLIDIAGGDPTKINTGVKDGNGNSGFDGQSFKKVLTGEQTHFHDYLFAEHTTRGIIQGSDAYGSRSIRSEKYLYILNLNWENKFSNVVTHSSLFKEWMQKDPTRASFYLSRPREELYDVSSDPYNLKNLSADTRYAAIKKQLNARLTLFMKQQNDKGVETEMEALSRQPKNTVEDH